MAILVTGGSKGIGRAIAERFAKDGARVLINYAHDGRAADETAAAVKEAGGEPTVLQADLSTPTGLQQLLQDVHGQVDRLHQVVHGAVYPVSSPAMELGQEEFSKAIWLNGQSFLHLVQGVRDLLGAGSSVFFLSSRGAKVVVPNYVGVGAPKALAESLVRYLAVELAGDGIRVTSVSPAGVLTDAVRAVLPNAEERFEALAELNPSGRNLDVTDIADLVHLLSSPEAEMFTGRDVVLDGGLYIRT